MATNRVETPPGKRPQVAPARRGGWGGWVVAAVVIAAGGGGLWWRMHRSPAATTDPDEEPAPASRASGPAVIEVVHPQVGGMERVSSQPGSVHAFEAADLYAKVSGYLKEQSVDIGDSVKQDQVLAVIDDPEILAAEKQAAAALELAKARIKQANAKLITARAEVDTAKADVKRYASEVAYRWSEYQRFEQLFKQGEAVQRQRVDEEREHYDTAVASEESSKTLVKAAEAKVEEAKADLVAAEADVDVAKDALEKARVFVEYTNIRSPYTGVVTKRSFHRGAFIRSASDGTSIPLLSVTRTDVMRVVTKVPDRDVPFVDRGDPAIVEIDALGGEEFKGPDVKVSRFAKFLDPDDRTMRTEVDLKNPDGRLREGMYGRTTIVLEPSTKALILPSSCPISESKGEAAVWVVRDKKLERKVVKVGRDDGLHVEILSGLSPDDEVVLHANSSMNPGMPVEPRLVAASGSPLQASHE